MINPARLLGFKKQLSDFTDRHPKFARFLSVASNDSNLKAGTVWNITIKREDGQEIHTNMRLSDEDAELIRQVKELLENK